MEKIGVVRIRGQLGTNKEILDTLNMLKLYKRNYCVMLEESKSSMGMIRKVNDFVAWGKINDEVSGLFSGSKFLKLKRFPSLKRKNAMGKKMSELILGGLK